MKFKSLFSVFHGFKAWNCILLITTLLFTLEVSPVLAARSVHKLLCQMPEFTCLKVKRNQTWESLWPDPRERALVMRLNHVNILLYPGMILAVPNKLADVDLMDFSPLPKQITPPAEKLLVFNPQLGAWGAYDAEGNLVRWGPASGGANWCPDIHKPCRTKAGTYRIFSLGSSACISHKFPLPDGGAPMPYCMYFNHGEAFHGEPYGLPGYNASHGCVRLFVKDAEWIRYDFVEPPDEANQFRGTKVIIFPYADK